MKSYYKTVPITDGIDYIIYDFEEADRDIRWNKRKYGVWLRSMYCNRNILNRLPEDISRFIIMFI